MDKKIICMTIIVLLLFGFSSCSNNADYLTPTGVAQESDLISYTNNKYNYTIGYPDIFTENEKASNGVTLKSDDTLLIVWAKQNTENLTLQESFDKACSQYQNVKDGGTGRIEYCFHFSDTDTESGYYHAIMYNNNIYSFVIVYPTDKYDEYEDYINQMIKSFLILP